MSIIASAVTARAGLHFTTPYVPGINGGYYLVQARSLSDHGVLGINASSETRMKTPKTLTPNRSRTP